MKVWKPNLINIAAHCAFWLLAGYALLKTMGIVSVESVTIINGVKRVTKVDEGEFFPVITIWVLSIGLFYTNILYLLPQWLSHRKLVRYILSFSVGLIVILLLDHFILALNQLAPWQFFPWVPGPRLLPYLLFTGLSFAYFFISEWIKGEQVKREMREHQLRSELNFLRSQIEPHFLFNSLNNLYYLAQETKHKELINGISGLSQMMRYMLYETNHETVPLKNEVQYLENYIQLQLLKFSKQDQIKFSFEKKGSIDQLSIAPMILLPFVENAFKYGINYESQTLIVLYLEGTADEIMFRVTNSNHSIIHKLKEEKNGIGLDNVKRRLQLIYPQRHTLVIDDKPDIFFIQLQLKLQHS